MFAKRVKSQNIKRDFHLGLGRNAATIRACNDNQPVRLTSRSRLSRRTGLFCRWRQTPAGRLECCWHSDRVPPESGEEGISRLAQRGAVSRRAALFAA